MRIGDADPAPAAAARDGAALSLTYNGKRQRFDRALDTATDTLWLSRDGRSWAVEEHSILEGAHSLAGAGGPITSPMPGTVLAVNAKVGDAVTAGTALLVVEAMKMEHAIKAPVDGVLTELNVQAGQQVSLAQPLAVVTPTEEAS